MDASDAADYVQELAGESASIIFGAMYDDTKSDECTITVIATGLHNVGGSASKLKARLEGQQKVGSILPSGGESHVRSTLDHERRAGRNNADTAAENTFKQCKRAVDQDS